MSSVYLKIFQINYGKMKIENVFCILNQKIKLKFNNTIRFLKLKIEILIQIDKTKIQNKTVNQKSKNEID